MWLASAPKTLRTWLIARRLTLHQMLMGAETRLQRLSGQAGPRTGDVPT
jgi:hypothetical protein